MKIITYADVVSREKSSRTAGVGPVNEGELLADILKESGGKYEAVMVLSESVRKELQRVASQVRSAGVAAAAEKNTITISLEHLRGHDPKTTRVVYGFMLEAEEGDPPVAVPNK